MTSDKNKLDVFFKELGKLTTRFRKEKKFSLEELGLRIGLDRSATHRLEKGQHITVTTLIKLCLALDKKPKDFFEIDFNFKPSELSGLITSKKSSKKAKGKKKGSVKKK